MKLSFRRWKAYALGLIPLLLAGTLFAQNTLSDVVGIPQDAAIYPIPGVGFVNLNNGNLHISLPLRTVIDRNGTSLTSSLVYDNSDFQMVSVQVEGGCAGCTESIWTASVGPNQAPALNEWISGLRIEDSPDYSGTVTSTAKTFQGCAGGSGTNGGTGGYSNCTSGNTNSNWVYTDPNGTVHPFPPSFITGGAGLSSFGIYQTGQVVATDGSGYWLEVTNGDSGNVYDIHGNSHAASGLDINGNHTGSGGSDKLGRPALLPSSFVEVLKTVNVWTDFEGSDLAAVALADIKGAYSGLSSITLPDGRSYTFQYDDAGNPAQLGHYGSLTGITLPTGGQITIVSEVVQSAGTNPNPNLVVKQVTTADGTWSFSYSAPSGSNYFTVITATAPIDLITGLSAQTVSSYSGSTHTVSTYAGAATGNPLQTIATQYTYNGPSTITTTLGNGQKSSVAYTYVDGCTPRVASKKEYDFSGNLLRETDVGYLTSASDNTNLCIIWPGNGPSWTDSYLQSSHHITDIPSSVTVYGPNGCCGSPIAQTNYQYDSTALSTSSGTAGNSVAGLPVHDDVDFGASMTIRGNPTVISQMTGPGSFITTKTNYYNILGELVSTVDGDGNSTSFDYTDSWNNSSCYSAPLISTPVFAYPTTVTNAKGQVSKMTYNSCDGSTASSQNSNDFNASRPGTSYAYDSSQRVINTTYPDGGMESTSYSISIGPEVITKTDLINGSQSMTKTTTLDGLGRPILTTSVSDPYGTDSVRTTYDSRGRVLGVTNPYRTSSDPTYGTTSYAYDALGRMTYQCQPDNTPVNTIYCAPNSDYESWTYSGNIKTVRDGAGNQWQQTSDALGRVTKVLEPSGITQTPTMETDYTYNGLSDLLSVVQWGGASGSSGARTRSFTYDSLSRLLTSANPESGSIDYSYDANSNLSTKTDARGIITGYSYDALNRLLSKSYSDDTSATPWSCYQYDSTSNGIGRLSNEWTQSTLKGACPASVPASGFLTQRSILAYDPVGRILHEQQCTPANCAGNPYQLTYTYDLAGNVLTSTNGVTNPNITLTSSYDSADRLNEITSSLSDSTTHPSNLFQATAYGPVGLTNAVLGYTPETSYATVNLSRAYDNRLRLTSYVRD